MQAAMERQIRAAEQRGAKQTEKDARAAITETGDLFEALATDGRAAKFFAEGFLQPGDYIRRDKKQWDEYRNAVRDAWWDSLPACAASSYSGYARIDNANSGVTYAK